MIKESKSNGEQVDEQLASAVSSIAVSPKSFADHMTLSMVRLS